MVFRELAQVAFVKLPHLRRPWLVVMYVGKPSLCNSIVDVSYQRAREQGLALPLGISENGPNSKHAIMLPVSLGRAVVKDVYTSAITGRPPYDPRPIKARR